VKTGDFNELKEICGDLAQATDRWQDLRQKIEDYFSIDVDHVWVVEPAPQHVLIFDSPTDMRKFTRSDVFEADGVLAGFSLKVSDLFVT